MKVRTKHIWTLVSIVVMAFVATTTQAQTKASDPQGPSWTFGLEGGVGALNGIGQPQGSISSGKTGDSSLDVPSTKKGFVAVEFGLKPISGWGGNIRYTSFAGGGERGDSVAQADGAVNLWHANDTPKFNSTAPVLVGSVGYSLQSSAKFSRVDFVLNDNFAIPGGWLSASFGGALLKTEVSAQASRDQRLLLYAKLPNGTLDTRGDSEDYSYHTSATSSSTLFGLTGALEGEASCKHLVFHGRAGVGVFPWGSASTSGQFTATKDIYLVAVAGGLNATPISTLAHLNLPSATFHGNAKQTTVALDGTFGVAYRLKADRGNKVVDLGVSVTGLTMSNVPGAPDYAISDGFAPGNGRFSAQSSSISMGPVITAGIRFWWGGKK